MGVVERTAVVRRYPWADLASAPEGAGVYSWYLKPSLGVPDIEMLRQHVELQVMNEQRGAAAATVLQFMQEHLLSPFEEDPYLAQITGPLKPRYEGALRHVNTPSAALVERIVDNVSHLAELVTALGDTVPVFASPLYIGVAESLRKRLMQHRHLILRFREQGVGEENDDGGFAKQVVRRGINPSQLLAFTYEMPLRTGAQDFENLVNRVYTPRFGRN